jgi:FlaA1/EpsC-like NDP-sugar epimerase
MSASHQSTGGVPGWHALRTDAHLVALDALIVIASLLVALALRFDGRVPSEYWNAFPAFCAVAVVLYVGLHAVSGLYGRVWLQAGPAEAWQLVVASVSAVTLLMALVLTTAPVHVIPLSVPLNGGAIALLLLGGLRFSSRILAARAARNAVADLVTDVRVVLVGPVGAARAVLAQMRAEPQAGLLPVAVVTDDRTAWRRTLAGVPVTGPLEQLATVACLRRADQVLIVPGGPEGTEAAAVAELAREAGLRARLLPTLHESVDDRPRLRDIRDLSVEDLLGRDPVAIDDGPIRSVLRGRRVLVTGAGGSIGREIAVQVARSGPKQLLLLDHDETHLHDVGALLAGASATFVLGDIRDEVFVEKVFAQHEPEVVFHAAAHKHVPILEDFPSEAVRTNVHGSDVLLRTAVAHGTGRFVAISTDKAVDPVCVMGASKRLAEQLVVHRRQEGMRYCAVRFGNVLGSRGSVVPTFVRQVQQGGPVTVTHPDMTRFFMTTHEAVHLVLEAATRCEGGEVFMLDMGRPIRILDLARRIITLSGASPDDEVSIEFTGLRPGEKLEEQLYSDAETVSPTSHPKILLVRGRHLPVGQLFAGVARLRQLADRHDEEGARRLLFELARLPDEIDLDGQVVQLPTQWEQVAPVDEARVRT